MKCLNGWSLYSRRRAHAHLTVRNQSKHNQQVRYEWDVPRGLKKRVGRTPLQRCLLMYPSASTLGQDQGVIRPLEQGDGRTRINASSWMSRVVTRLGAMASSAI